MYQLGNAQETSTAKLPAFFQRFQIKEYILYVSKAKITNENAFNGDYFRTEGSHE